MTEAQIRERVQDTGSDSMNVDKIRRVLVDINTDLTNTLGTPGAPGLPGSAGADGVDGVDGVDGAAGNSGIQGVQGIAGTNGAVGPAGLSWSGAWVSGDSYTLNDAVGFGGASYYCITATTGTVDPATDTANWALLASQGANGAQGIQGIQGIAGTNGTNGTNGAVGPAGVLVGSVNDLTNGFGDGSSLGIGSNSVASTAAFKSNTGVGEYALLSVNTGGQNSSFGNGALYSNIIGNNNTAVGYVALKYVLGENNTAVGSSAASQITTGINNVAIGVAAASSVTTGNYNIAIGAFASIAQPAADHQLNIGNWIYGSQSLIGIGVSIPTEKLHVNGGLRVTGKVVDSTNTAGTAGQVLSSTAVGTAWVDAAAAPAYTVYKARIVTSSGGISVTQFENTIGDGSGDGVNDIEWTSVATHSVNGELRGEMVNGTPFPVGTIWSDVPRNQDVYDYTVSRGNSNPSLNRMTIFIKDSVGAAVNPYTTVFVEIKVYA